VSRLLRSGPDRCLNAEHPVSECLDIDGAEKQFGGQPEPHDAYQQLCTSGSPKVQLRFQERRERIEYRHMTDKDDQCIARQEPHWKRRRKKPGQAKQAISVTHIEQGGHDRRKQCYTKRRIGSDCLKWKARIGVQAGSDEIYAALGRENELREDSMARSGSRLAVTDTKRKLWTAYSGSGPSPR